MVGMNDAFGSVFNILSFKLQYPHLWILDPVKMFCLFVLFLNKNLRYI